MPMETRQLIKNQFIELYMMGGLKTATIKSLCEKIPIARTTFYAYYADIYSVLEEIEDEIIHDLFVMNENFINCDLRNYKRGVPMDCFKETLNYVKKHKNIISALLGKNYDASFIYKWKKIIKHHFKEKYKKEFMTYKHIDLVLEQIASSIIGAYSYWVVHNEEISEEEFSKLCCPQICFDFIN